MTDRSTLRKNSRQSGEVNKQTNFGSGTGARSMSGGCFEAFSGSKLVGMSKEESKCEKINRSGPEETLWSRLAQSLGQTGAFTTDCELVTQSLSLHY